MEYRTDQYRRNGEKVFSFTDGHKYVCHKIKGNAHYLRCALYKKQCKGTAKLDKEINLIYTKSEHNHEIQEYCAEAYAIKTECKTVSQTSQHNLWQIFDNVTRSNPSASEVTFKERDSSMFRTRKGLYLNIPASALEFSHLLTTTKFAVKFKATVQLEHRKAVIFFSDKLLDIFADISGLHFDGAFYTVPKQFYQLWTIFFKKSWPSYHTSDLLFTYK